MKIDGLTHPKTKELAFTLDIPLPHAIGLLELMWAFVGQQTPQGNVGKWSNQVIAGEAGWRGDANEFIRALISVGFLDENEDHRLLVHDWQEHAPNWVHAKLKKKGRDILSGYLSADLREGKEPASEGATNVVKSNEAKGSRGKPREKRGFSPPSLAEVKAYCDKRGNHVDPEAFIDFYESKGWYIGKNKMKDWRAAVRTWEKKQRGNGNGSTDQKANTAYDRAMSKIDEWARSQTEGGTVIDGESVEADD